MTVLYTPFAEMASSIFSNSESIIGETMTKKIENVAVQTISVGSKRFLLYDSKIHLKGLGKVKVESEK